MKQNSFAQRNSFMAIGVLMAVIGISFLFYMGNSLYQTSQRMHHDYYSVCVSK
ncbi:hypothetical protein [Bacteroides sedimenti]|uniref:hypothetical protein n=1 Tax=Bacteroides sedimenti TaxID=2136147 RepID=UPI003340B21A